MVEKRRFNRIPVYIRIKEIDRNPKGESNLLNISAFGAKIETTTRYRTGDLIKFSYIPPGPSLSDLENENKSTAILSNSASMIREKSIKGKVVWIANHPEKASYFLVGVKHSTAQNGYRSIISIITLLIVVATGVWIVKINHNFMYDCIDSVVEWSTSFYNTITTSLFNWFPL